MPFTPDEYALLRGGPEGIAKWNTLRKSDKRFGERPRLARAILSGVNLSGVNLNGADLSAAYLSGADLSEANLSGADLSGADLSGTNLGRANLSGADLARANLRGADLARANLRGVNLIGTNLSGVNLSGTNLSGMNLIGTNLNGANLSGTNLSGVNLTDTLLREAGLSCAILENALFKWADLTDATVEDADITGVVVHELRGFPRPPHRLRLERNEKEVILTGAEAANFFVLPAIVEVYLTRTLTETEAGLLQVQHGAVHVSGAARDVYLIGHRREGDGSVLRFQGPTYEAVYAALPDLLAPFRTTAAIDWKATLDSIPKDAQSGALVALAEAALQDRRQRWPIAKKLAQVFDAFAHAEVRELKEGRSQGMVIKVATSKTMLQRLDPPAKGSMTLMVGENNRLAMLDNGEVIEMGDTTTVNAAGAIVGSAIGTNASVSAGGNISAEIHQITSPALAELAGAVKQSLVLLADTRLTKTEREQAEKHVEEIQAEAKKTPPNPEGAGKIRGWLDSLTKLCKPAADLIAGAKAVAATLGLGV